MPSSARATDGEKESIVDDVVFEIELIKQVEINVDYILMLVEKYRTAKGDGEDREIKEQITRAIDASPSLRNKKDLIEDFVDSVSPAATSTTSGRPSSQARRESELDAHHRRGGLNPEETRTW
jgi:type I restriction enzyme R subunit